MDCCASLLMGAWLLLSSGASPHEQKQPTAAASNQKANASGATAGSQISPIGSEYKIGAQDVLRIDVWKEDQLTRTVPVRPDGKVTLPLLNDVQAAGLTPRELADIITEGLKKFINSPQVTVTVAEINSRRVYVTGEVTRPGAFPLLPDMTVLQALSSSGSFTQFAKLKNIFVLRVEDGKQVKHPFNYKEAVNGKNPEQDMLLQPGDIIVVP
jgi:polysaccharide export outer membrane protein